MTAEEQRLQENRDHTSYWHAGDPTCERQWGTVRKITDQMAQLGLLSSLPAPALIAGGDGIAGISITIKDCVLRSPFEWRGPILKEFGLTEEGNHGEMSKNYFYLDNTYAFLYEISLQISTKLLFHTRNC